MANEAIKADTSVSQLRCIGCGRIALPDRFRCEHCRDLLEIVFPGWDEQGPAGLDAEGLKQLWVERQSSFDPADRSGVWRFREILPEITRKKSSLLRKATRRCMSSHTAQRVPACSSFSPSIRE